MGGDEDRGVELAWGLLLGARMDTIQQALTREHHRLLALLDAALRELAEGDDATPTITAFARRLRAQLRIEEELLFPAAERIVQDVGYPPTAALRREHEVFARLLGDVERDLARADRDAAMGDLRE